MDCGEVCVFLCLWCPRLGIFSFPHAVSHWGHTEQCQAVCEYQTTGDSATTVPHVAVCSTSCGRGSCIQEHGVRHGSFDFSGSHTLLFWDHYPKPQVLYYEQHRYAEITLSEKIWEMRKDSGWHCETVCQVWGCQWHSVWRLYQPLSCTSAIYYSRKSCTHRWPNLLASGFAGF